MREYGGRRRRQMSVGRTPWATLSPGHAAVGGRTRAADGDGRGCQQSVKMDIAKGGKNRRLMAVSPLWIEFIILARALTFASSFPLDYHHRCGSAMSDNSTSPALPASLDLPPHLSAHKYFFVCTLTVAAWDTLVLSPRSWRLFRTKEWPFLKIAYHFLRIFMPVEFTIVGVAFFDTKWSLEVSILLCHAMHLGPFMCCLQANAFPSLVCSLEKTFSPLSIGVDGRY